VASNLSCVDRGSSSRRNEPYPPRLCRCGPSACEKANFVGSLGVKTRHVSPFIERAQFDCPSTYDVIAAGTCPAVKGASALDIRFLDASIGGGGGYPITNSAYSTDSWLGITDGNCFGTGSYTFTYPWLTSPTNSWTAATPNP
jgi:hypothetical protein